MTICKDCGKVWKQRAEVNLKHAKRASGFVVDKSKKLINLLVGYEKKPEVFAGADIRNLLKDIKEQIGDIERQLKHDKVI